MEFWDIYDADKKPTGRTMKRNDWCLKDGEYHLTVLGVVARPDKTFLITKRVMTKAWAPGWWEVSGGAAQAGESSWEAVRREVREETGLEIVHPLFCGVYHWMKAGVHNILFLYKAREFSGNLASSEEGRVYWVPLEEFREKELATGMEYVLQIMESSETGECCMSLKDGKYVGTLY